MTQHLDLDALQAAAEARNLAGAQLANVVFNWSQQCGYALTSDDCEMLRKLYKKWDENANVAPALIDRLRKAEADAKRYQWLRHGDNDELVIQNGPIDQDYYWLPRNDRLDAMIDQYLPAAPDSTPTDSADSEGENNG